MGAAEGAAHLGTEPIGDVVTGNPCARPVTQRCGPVGSVGLGADDDDAAARIAAQLVPAAPRKVSSVDDDEIGRRVAQGVTELTGEK